VCLTQAGSLRACQRVPQLWHQSFAKAKFAKAEFAKTKCVKSLS
jgi:hypothetical protein